MSSIFLESALLLFFYGTAWFAVSIFIRRNDFADIAWGFGYVILSAYHAYTGSLHPVVAVCYVLICFWGMRLTIYLFARNSKKSEDFRYLKWRKEWGNWFYLRSFLQVYLLQAAFLLVIISPTLFAASFKESSWSFYTTAGVLMWIFGFYWQVVGDQQLRRFIRNRNSKDEVLQTGLWKYTRHPNYFGEVTMWWGIYVVVWPLPGSWPFMIGPITITLLIRYVSGVPMLEKRYADNARYQVYKEQVPALFPNLLGWLKSTNHNQV